MNKQDLIDFVSDKTGLTKIDSNKSIDAVFDGIVSGLKTKKEAKFVGFGSFETRSRAACKGRNPRTGVEIEIPASNGIKFKAFKEFKAAINDAS